MIVESGICSISPAPKTGVGIRNIKLLALCACTKSGCDGVHDLASVIPAIVNRSCTPPSDGNRAARTGPFGVMKNGRLFVAGLRRLLKNATCGFPVGGLVPPTAGLMWQPEQLLRFMVGPRPSVTPSTWVNCFCELVKRSASGFDKFWSIPPAPASPSLRIPGSLGSRAFPGGCCALAA